LGVPPTVLEGGWNGVLVLEFSNHTSNSVRLYANSGAAQILFFQGEQPEVSYADRNGKYQNQTGITLAKSK
jgi:dCTP deaminase